MTHQAHFTPKQPGFDAGVSVFRVETHSGEAIPVDSRELPKDVLTPIHPVVSQAIADMGYPTDHADVINAWQADDVGYWINLD